MQDSCDVELAQRERSGFGQPRKIEVYTTTKCTASACRAWRDTVLCILCIVQGLAGLRAQGRLPRAQGQSPPQGGTQNCFGCDNAVCCTH